MLIDNFCDDWLAQLDTMVSAACHACLLLDGAFHADIVSLVRQWPVPVPQTQALFLDTPGSTIDTLKVSPWVLPYEAGDEALHALLETCTGLPMVSVIVSTETPEQVARRLAPWCVVRADDMHFNFRFPDTRRLPRILSVLDDTQLSALVGPATSWHYMGRDGHWHACETIRHGKIAGQQRALTPSLTDEQFALLLSDSEADEILSVLTPDLLPETLSWKPSARYDSVHATLAFADACQLLDQGDRIELCSHALTSATALQRMQSIRQKHPGADVIQLTGKTHD